MNPWHPPPKVTTPPKTPPTATATAAGSPDDTAPAALVPLPPGYTLGPLVVNTVAPDANRRETFSRSLVAPSGAGIQCRGFCPAEALAIALAEAWQHYFTRHPKSADAAAREVCRRPHPRPTGGLATAGPLVERHTFQFPVCLTDTPEVVNVGERKPAPAVTVAGAPRRFSTTMRLEAVGEEWDGRIQTVTKPSAKPVEIEFVSPDPKRVAAAIQAELNPFFADLMRRFRDDVARHSRDVMEAATRARAAVPPEPVAPYETVRRTECGTFPLDYLPRGAMTMTEARERAAGSAYCDPAAAVRNPVWPAGWYDGKVCSRYTSRTYDAAAGRTPGMSSTFTHTGPQCDW